jgi:glutamate synthase domain-containing protein 3
MIGRSDLLRARDLSNHWKARTLDLRGLLYRPNVAPTVATRRVRSQDHPIDSVLDRQLIEAAGAALERRRAVRKSFAIRNHDRTVGAMLSGEVARRYAHTGLPDGTIRFGFTGSAGQSFGAFCTRGITLSLEGEANDYMGKGLSGGRLIVVPPKTARFDASETILVGNVALYGATSGEAYLHGMAGERFAVRNSGAVAVVEGVGDHGCEYMTGGVVVVLGKTGRNFAAGMSGGVAFVFNDNRAFERQCNTGMVAVEPVEDDEDVTLLERLVRRHARYTGSGRARRLLASWSASFAQFVRVMPTEYKRALEAQGVRHVDHLRSAMSVSTGNRPREQRQWA